MGSRIAYVFAMAVVGLGVGYFVALSRSPVVGVLLPLLFTLIAGAGGIYVAREDLSQKLGRRRMALLSACVIALVSSSILGSFLILAHAPTQRGPDLLKVPEFTTLSLPGQLAAIEVRKIALMLGSSDEEIAQLVKNLAKSGTDETPQTVLPKLTVLRQFLGAVIRQLDDNLMNALPDPETKQRFREARDVILISDALFQNWETHGASSFSVPVADQVLIRLKNSLEGITLGPSHTDSHSTFIKYWPTSNAEIPPPAPRGGANVDDASKEIISLFKVKPSVLETLLSLRSALELNKPIMPETDRKPAVDQILTSDRVDLLKVVAGMPSRQRPNWTEGLVSYSYNP
jgi:hypothetical protein